MKVLQDGVDEKCVQGDRWHIIGRDFSESDLRGVVFKGDDLSFCRFNGNDLSRTTFVDCALEQALFIECNLNDTVLKGCMCLGADFTKATTERTVFFGATLIGATITSEQLHVAYIDGTTIFFHKEKM